MSERLRVCSLQIASEDNEVSIKYSFLKPVMAALGFRYESQNGEVLSARQSDADIEPIRSDCAVRATSFGSQVIPETRRSHLARSAMFHLTCTPSGPLRWSLSVRPAHNLIFDERVCVYIHSKSRVFSTQIWPAQRLPSYDVSPEMHSRMPLTTARSARNASVASMITHTAIPRALLCLRVHS